MIKAHLFYQGNACKSAKIEGHANYDKKGSDIVCAACSVLVRTTVRYLQATKLLKASNTTQNCVTFTVEETGVNPAAEVAMQMLQLGLTDLESEFPSYIKLIIKRK